MVLVRKVELALWTVDPPAGLDPGEVPADLFRGSELRTDGNTLSFWEFHEADEGWLDEAVLAIVGGWKQIAGGLHLAWIDRGQLDADGIVMDRSDGRTVFAKLAKNHVDATRLDVVRLAKVACHIGRAMRASPPQFRTLTRAELLGRVARAVMDRRVGLANLPSAMQSDVAREISSAKPAP